MVCGNIAVQRLALDVDAFAAVAGSPERLEALRAFVERATERGVTSRTLDTWWHGAGGTPFQATWVDVNGRATVVVAEGQIFVQGADAALVKLLSPLVKRYTERVAVDAATDRTVAGLGARFRVKRDVRTPTGARVVRVSI